VEREVQKYFLYALKSIQCVECGITEIYLLLIAENLLKYILLLFFFFLVLRHIALLVASLVVARNWSLGLPGRPTQAVRHTCSSKLGIVKILRY
jgi:hypothetical protein